MVWVQKIENDDSWLIVPSEQLYVTHSFTLKPYHLYKKYVQLERLLTS